MDSRLADEPATRWDRLVAVLEDVDPERVIDASHIIERERKLNMTDLELFYVLAMYYQECDSRVLNEVLNLYVLITTWMQWLDRCDLRLSAHGKAIPRAGNSAVSPRASATPSAIYESSVTVPNRLHREMPSSRLRSPFCEDLESTVAGSLAGSAPSSSIASPLTRSATTMPAGKESWDSYRSPANSVTPRLLRSQSTSGPGIAPVTDAEKNSAFSPLHTHGGGSRKRKSVLQGRLWDSDAKTVSMTGGTRPPVASSTEKSDPATAVRTPREQHPGVSSESFLAKFNLPPNWTDEGTVDFLRDGKLLCELIEVVIGQAVKADAACKLGDSFSGPSRYDPRFPSLADIDRLTNSGADNRNGGSGGGSGAASALRQLHNVTVVQGKPRGGRNSKSSRAMCMLQAQEKTVVETEKAVARLNRLCEEVLGWNPEENQGEPFFRLPKADRVLRPLNADDYWMAHRLHWLAVALFKTVNDPDIVPLPPPVSFLLTRQKPDTVVDDAEEKSELALMIATKCSCLPHNCKTQVILVDGTVIQLSHPQAHPQPLLFPCCLVDGEAFVFVESKSSFTPLWRLLRRLVQQWDRTTWMFELRSMGMRAEKVLKVGAAASFMPPGTPLSHTSVSMSGPLSPTRVVSASNAQEFHTPTEDSIVPPPATRGSNATVTGSSALSTHSDSALPHRRTSSGIRANSTSFNLTIKTSTLRTGRTPANLSFAHNGPSESVPYLSHNASSGLAKSTVTSPFLRPTAPTAAGQPFVTNRSFADDALEESTSGASFAGGVTMVRGGRRAVQPLQENMSITSVEREGPQTRIPLSVAVRAGRAAPGSPIHPPGPLQALACMVSVAVTGGASSVSSPNVDTTHATNPSIVASSEAPKEGVAMRSQMAAAVGKSQPFSATPSRASWLGSATSVTSPLPSPNLQSTPSSDVFLPARGPDDLTGCRSEVSAQSGATPVVSGRREAGVDDGGEMTRVRKALTEQFEDGDAAVQPAPIASATLSAVQAGDAANVESDIREGNSLEGGHAQENAHEGSFTPYHDDEDDDHEENQLQYNSTNFYHSEYLRVKNFSATLVHETHESGIDVRDHHFRVSGRPVGKGAFGAVYRALDLETGVIVAVKQSRYSIDTHDQDNLNWREFQTWSMLPAHPNVITFYGASKEVETRQLLLVLEFASGGSIVAMYQHYRPIPEHLFLQHARGIALGLKHLHDHNVIHGDMKPENVLTRSDGSVAITDFGCSRLTLRAALEDGTEESPPSARPARDTGVAAWQLFGTAAFMAPEVITNEPDFKSDVWAYVCTLGYLWLGRAPWSLVPDTMDVHDSIPLMFYIASHEEAAPFTQEQLAQTPRWMQRLAQRAFEHDVEKRASMSEVISILAEYS